METDTGDYYAKPMNCPFHVLVYKSQVRSYRDLPMRLSELGTIYRHEKIGTLHGLLRIRGGTQDDSHIICTPEQLIDEILAVFDLTLEIHRTFGFTDLRSSSSTLPTGQSIVDEATAARATEALTALEKSGLDYRIAEGEGAFYGPKVDFHFRDDRPPVAAHHGPVRLRAARALRHGVHGRRQPASPAGDDPPRDPRDARALQRRADRALRRARSRCGWRPSSSDWCRSPTDTCRLQELAATAREVASGSRSTSRRRPSARRSGPRS